RTPGYADGPGATRLYALESRTPFRSSRSHLAQSRPLCAVERPCLYAALVRPPPDENTGGECRIRDTRKAFCDTRRHPPFSSTRQQGGGPPGVSLGIWRRDDYRSIRTRSCNERGYGDREKWLASHYNRPNFQIFDYNIYAICGDGCLMEGVGSEAASLAGHLRLDNLCWIYDNNHISLEGSTRLTFTEDVAARFMAYVWNILRLGYANDTDAIQRVLGTFMERKVNPTFI